MTTVTQQHFTSAFGTQPVLITLGTDKAIIEQVQQRLSHLECGLLIKEGDKEITAIVVQPAGRLTPFYDDPNGTGCPQVSDTGFLSLAMDNTAERITQMQQKLRNAKLRLKIERINSVDIEALSDEQRDAIETCHQSILPAKE
jgi:hypothetical protein